MSGFFKVPNGLIDDGTLARLSRPSSAKVLMVLLRYADRDGFAFPGRRAICKAAGVSSDTADASIDDLIACDVIERATTNYRSGYRFNMAQKLGRSEAEHGPEIGPCGHEDGTETGPSSAQHGPEIGPSANQTWPSSSETWPNSSANMAQKLGPTQSITQKKKKSRASSSAPRFLEIDSEIAKEIFAGVQRLNPEAKDPNFDTWANAVRLMRETDGRTPERIRAVFAWANRDSFWQKNILSPTKLRKQFDDLLVKSGLARMGSQSPKTITDGPRVDRVEWEEN
ncbi:MAG: hypothetical protein KDB23_29970 [Planctomycetales bacterium]|nr:hypothetical protein [Planctomycetales bacterium]